jgi:hypothetical protein
VVTIENVVGRLVEIRQTGGVSMEEIQQNNPKMQKIISAIGGPVLVAADWRGIRVLSPNVADTLLKIMQSNSPVVERTGVMIDSSAVVGLQLERFFRETKTKHQTACRETAHLEKWFADAMTIPERTRLHRFLNEPVDSSDRK